MTPTTWYEEHGRHQIYAGGKKVELGSTEHNLVLDPEAVAAGKQEDLDEAGIGKKAREEKLRAQRQKAGTSRRNHITKQSGSKIVELITEKASSFWTALAFLVENHDTGRYDEVRLPKC